MAGPGVSATLQALEERLMDPAVRARPEAVGALLHEDFTEIGRSGRLWARAEILEALRAEPGRDGPRTLAEFAARALGEGVVLVTYRVPETRTRRASVWRQEGEGWRLLFHQGTPEAEAAAPSRLGGGRGGA